MNEEYTKKLLQQYEELSADFSEAHDWMNQIYHYCLPHRYNLKYNPQDKNLDLPKDVYDSTMIQACDIFASGIHGYLMNQSSQWFRLETQDKRDMDKYGVKAYFEDVERILYSIAETSNFYYESRESCSDLSVGNAVLYFEEHPDYIVNFSCINPTSCVWAENEVGRVDTLFRMFKYSSSQMMEKFGNACSKKVKECIKNGKFNEKFEVIHAVRPRWQRDRRKKDAINKAYESIYFEKEAKNILSESGYDYFPFAVVRYVKNSGQVIGYGAGHISLPDARMLNEAMMNEITAQQLDVNPVKSVPADSFLLPILSAPGDINYRISSDPNDKIDYLRSGSNHQANEMFMDKCRDRINSAFHKDFFLAISDATKRMTIPEVQERIAEKMPMLGSGSGISRIMGEMLAPVVEFMYSVAAKKQLLPDVPESLAGVNYKVAFVSPLAKAQKVGEIRSLQSTINSAAQLAQLNPDTLDNFDFDRIARDANDIGGGKAVYLREIKDRDAYREERNKRIAEQNKKQELLMAAQGAAESSKADLNLSKAGQVKK